MSFDRTDIENFNKCNFGGSANLLKGGDKHGRMRGIFSATVGLATGLYNLVGVDGQVAYIPAGVVITRFSTKVLTNFASADSTATLAFGVNTTVDMAAAAAVSGAWQTGTMAQGVPVTATASTWVNVPITTKLPITCTVGVEALTAGKLVAYVEWFFWGDIPLT
jgi:hypothetical protein